MRTSPDRMPRPLRRHEPQSRTNVAFSVGPRIVAGFIFGAALVGGVGGWAATTDLSGAILASGSVAVDQRAKSVQHRDGGVVGEILVRDGQPVTASQVLLRIDDAQTRAELAIVKDNWWNSPPRRRGSWRSATGSARSASRKRCFTRAPRCSRS